MDENMSQYLEENIKHFGTKKTKINNEDFQESNKMHGAFIPRLYSFGCVTHVTASSVYFCVYLVFHLSREWTHVRKP